MKKKNKKKNDKLLLFIVGVLILFMVILLIIKVDISRKKSYNIKRRRITYYMLFIGQNLLFKKNSRNAK